MPSSGGRDRSARSPLRLLAVRVLLATWLFVVLFFYSLQRGLYKRAGDGKAEQYLRAAAEVKPHLFRVQVRLARLLRQHGQSAEAAEHYEAALRAADRPADLTFVQRELAALRGAATTATQER